MGFLDKVKKAFDSKKEDVESRNSVNDEIIDKPAPIEKIRNFKYLDNLIHSGVKEIVLDSDIILCDGEEYEYLEGIKLDTNNLAIDGNGFTIDAKGKARIFYCTAKNISIKNITLKNGVIKDFGGGAIYNREGELTIHGSILTGNAAQSGTDGGAIKNFHGDLEITESTFIKNTAQSGGGAIGNNGYAIIKNCSFKNNSSTREGGAISNFGELIITGSILSENTSKGIGGVIYNGGIEFSITDTILSQNTTEYCDGGVIFNEEGSFKVSDCKISNNNSKESIICNYDYMEIFNSVFKDNQAEKILDNDFNGTISILLGEFLDNVAETIVYNYGKYCFIKKSLFKNSDCIKTIINKSDLTLNNPKIKDEGRTILNEEYILIQEGEDILNHIDGEGEIDWKNDLFSSEEKFDFGYLDRKIHENNSKLVILDEDICLEKYEIDYYEGGIELDIDDLVIDGNGHTIDGCDNSRMFIITGKNITLKNITFKNGRSHENYDTLNNANGGAVKTNYCSNLIIENCKFINNASEVSGGAIFNSGDLTIAESILSENVASKWHGGAIYINKGNLNIVNSSLIENNAQFSYSCGGAIYNSEGKLCISSSKIIKNKAIKDGGAIFNDNGLLNISESTLTKNTSNQKGGSINNNGELIISNSTLTENTAPWGGGAIYNSGGKMIIKKSTLSKNVAQDGYGGGGAISNDGGLLTIMESILLENTAGNIGGAICNYSCELSITENCTFKDNKPDDVYGKED